MAYPTTINVTSAIVAFLYNHPGWPKYGVSPSPVYVYGLQLPEGWTLRKSVLALPDGGPQTLYPTLWYRMTFWCYGTTPLESTQVADVLFDCLHNSTTRTGTLNSEKIFIPAADIIYGPTFSVEPLTEWPRCVTAYQVQIDRYPN